MTGESYLSTALIPLLMTVVLAYYSFRLLVLQDVDSIYGKNKKKPKDKEGFAKAAGKLMVFLDDRVPWHGCDHVLERGFCPHRDRRVFCDLRGPLEKNERKIR